MGGFALRSAAAAPCHWDGLSTGPIPPGAPGTRGAASPPRPHAHPRGPGGCQQRAGRMAALNRASPPHRLLRSQPRPRASSRPPPPSRGCANASRHGSGHRALPWPPAVKMGKQDPGLALLYPPPVQHRVTKRTSGKDAAPVGEGGPKRRGALPQLPAPCWRCQPHPSHQQPCTATSPGANTPSSCLFSRKNPFSRGA